MSISEDKARKLVHTYINAKYSEHRAVKVELLAIKKVVSYGEYGWIFSYDTKKSIDNENWRYSLAGNHPIFVFKDSGDMYLLHPDINEEEIIRRHKEECYFSKNCLAISQ
jgi:Immunity protein 35